MNSVAVSSPAMPPESTATSAAEVGATLGVEEEYHLVDPETAQLRNSAAQVLAGSGARLQLEMLASQLEAATEICTDLEQVRRAVVEMRRAAVAAAQLQGVAILATSSHPFAALSEIELNPQPRYRALVDRFGTIVSQFNLCGCHVHVSVPDLETGVAVMNLARPYLPILAALTGSSPFHEGRDTGYESFRLAWLGLWPQGGMPPRLDGADGYRAAIAHSVEVGLISDASAMLWDLRPAVRYPTLEFRAADVCTHLDDAVLYAGLVRSLVRVLAARLAEDAPSPELSDPTLRAVRWRAARFGLADQLWSTSRAALVPAAVALEDFIAELRDDLDDHGEYAVITELLAGVLGRGTGASQQRQVYAASGSLVEVARDSMRLTIAAEG